MRRRDLLRGAVAAVSGGIAPHLLQVQRALAQTGDYDDPVSVLNYALVLEYLQAEYYRQANAAQLVSGSEAQLLVDIGRDERAHVAAITAAVQRLGGTPVPAPAVDFGQALRHREAMLENAFRFENSCLQGYLGALPALAGQPAVLQVAASIYGVEARHAALIAYVAGKPAADGVFEGPAEQPLPPAAVLTHVGPLFAAPIDMAGGAATTS